MSEKVASEWQWRNGAWHRFRLGASVAHVTTDESGDRWLWCARGTSDLRPYHCESDALKKADAHLKSLGFWLDGGVPSEARS